MFGGADNDRYVVDRSSDEVTEAVGEGTLDRVQTSATYSLQAGSEIEVLETTDRFGTTAIDLVGTSSTTRSTAITARTPWSAGSVWTS